jgi:uncharacterized membrane-anchored protein
MIRKLSLGLAAFVLALAAAPASGQPAGPEALPDESVVSVSPDEELTEEEYAEMLAAFDASLERRKGVITLPNANVTLRVPEGFYFLDAADARDVLVDAWGNPPDSATADGMLFPDGSSPTQEDAWGVVLTYEDTGYVSDEDASSIDYDMLIDTMRDGLEAENDMRLVNGYPKLDIIGWAAQPRYDAATHKLYWAKELSFDDDPIHTLNYDMRLGQLQEVEEASPAVLAIADFDPGYRYSEFNAATDTRSDLGIAGLIGGAAAATALAKNGGILAAVLIFLQKGWFIVVAAIGGLVAVGRSIFDRKGKAKVKAEQRSATAFFDGPAQEPPAATPPSDPPPSDPTTSGNT